jgi:hypothetical protein
VNAATANADPDRFVSPQRLDFNRSPFRTAPFQSRRQTTKGTAPRPGFEPGTPSLEARHDVRFTTGAGSGKRGSRTLTTSRSRALAERPGNPYPAAFRQRVPPAGLEPAVNASV